MSHTKDEHIAVTAAKGLLWPLNAGVFPREENLVKNAMVNAIAKTAQVTGYLPRLVGIEENPGPKKRTKLKQLQSKIQSQIDKAKNSAVQDLTSYSSTRRMRPLINSDALYTAPVAQQITMRPRTIFGSANFRGKNGLRVIGHQRVSRVFAYGSGPSFLQASSQTNYAIDPTVMTAPLSTIASAFMRFRFTKLILRYRSALASSTDGAFTLAYCSDPAAVTYGTISSATLSSLNDSAEFAVWNNCEVECTNLAKDSLLYNYNDGVNASSYRFGMQGVALIQGTIAKSDGTVLGDLWIDYEIEFYDLGDEANLKLIKAKHEDYVQITEKKCEEKCSNCKVN